MGCLEMLWDFHLWRFSRSKWINVSRNSLNSLTQRQRIKRVLETTLYETVTELG